MKHQKQPPRYRTFLITVWEERTVHGESVWRFRLEHGGTAKSQIFGSFEKLRRALKLSVGEMSKPQ